MKRFVSLILTGLLLIAEAVAASSSERASIEPLLKSSWGQQAPFNYLTPIIDGEHAKTGCVATALSQVIYFYGYPNKGKEGVYTNTGSTGDFSFDFANNTFDFGLMKDSYQTSVPETDESALEVSKLMLAAGITVDMNYGLESSSGTFSRLPKALSEWFLYVADGMGQLSKDNFTTEEWEDVIYSELKARRPVLYLGGNGTSSHVFVCDGYRDGRFHMNWGWYGQKNGYFNLNNLQTERVRDGSILSLNSSQRIVTGIRPPQNANPEPVATAKSFGYDPESGVFTFSGISCFSDNTVILPSIRLVDAQGAVIKDISAPESAVINRRSADIEFTLTDFDVADGRYKLRPVYRLLQASDEDKVYNVYCNIQNTRYFDVEIEDNQIKVADGKTDIEVNVAISNYYQYSSFIKNEIYNSGFSIFAENTGNANITRFGINLCRPGETEVVKNTNYPESLAPGESKTIALGIPVVDPGDYDLIIYDNATKTVFGEPQRITVHDNKKIVTLADSPFRFMPLSDDPYEAIVLYSLSGNGNENREPQITIAPTVTIGGLEYKITEIGPRLLFNRNDIERLELSTNVKKIDPNAFAGCTNLSEIIIDASLPPVVHPTAFDAKTMLNAKVRVPKQSLELYREAPVWKNFSYIDAETYIETITEENRGKADLYNISGILIARNVNLKEMPAWLAPGLYIVRTTAKTYKMLKH